MRVEVLCENLGLIKQKKFFSFMYCEISDLSYDMYNLQLLLGEALSLFDWVTPHRQELNFLDFFGGGLVSTFGPLSPSRARLACLFFLGVVSILNR